MGKVTLWTREEELILINNIGKKDCELGKMLGRSSEAIKKHRYKMDLMKKKKKEVFLPINPTRENVEMLLNAVVIQAANDYRDLIKQKRKGGKTYYYNDKRYLAESRLDYEIIKIERFFRSDSFRFYADIDGDSILKKLQEEFISNERSAS